MSTVKNLMPIIKLKEDQPQGLFLANEDNFLNLLDTYLHKIQKIEGLTPDEYIKKALKSDIEFAHDPTEEDSQRNKKDTMRTIYSTERFIFNKAYREDDLNVLTNP